MRKTIPIIVCDRRRHRSETPADDELVIVLGGERSTVDLCAACAKEARRVLKPFLADATGPGRSRGTSTVTQDAEHRRQTAEVRTWAEKQGLELASRGRIPEAVLRAYAEAHGG